MIEHMIPEVFNTSRFNEATIKPKPTIVCTHLMPSSDHMTFKVGGSQSSSHFMVCSFVVGLVTGSTTLHDPGPKTTFSREDMQSFLGNDNQIAMIPEVDF